VWLHEADRLDLAVYAAIAATPTPAMDVGLRRPSRAADHSKLLGRMLGGPRGGGRATRPLRRRERPGVDRAHVGRRQPRPQAAAAGRAGPRRGGGAARTPRRDAALDVVAVRPFGVRVRLRDLVRRGVAGRRRLAQRVASFVAYSRVHTGVHYRSDTIAGTVSGVALPPLAAVAALRRRRAARSRA
jgi:undecaprenyl-diphosphatase